MRKRGECGERIHKADADLKASRAILGETIDSSTLSECLGDGIDILEESLDFGGEEGGGMVSFEAAPMKLIGDGFVGGVDIDVGDLVSTTTSACHKAEASEIVEMSTEVDAISGTIEQGGNDRL